MKQVIIRNIPGLHTIYDVVYGQIVDGEFKPSTSVETDFPIPPTVHRDDLLGGTSYLKRNDLLATIRYYSPLSSSCEFFSNFIVFNLKPDYATSKTKKDEER